MTSIPLKVYGTPESPLISAATVSTALLQCPQREGSDIVKRLIQAFHQLSPLSGFFRPKAKCRHRPTKVHPSFLKGEHAHVLFSLTHCFSS